MTPQSYQQKLEAILDELYQIGVLHGQAGVSLDKRDNFRLSEAIAAITQLNLEAIGEDEKTLPNNHKDCHKQDARIALRAELRSIMAPETHIDRGTGFTHSEGGNCPCLDPNAKEDTL